MQIRDQALGIIIQRIIRNNQGYLVSILHIIVHINSPIPGGNTIKFGSRLFPIEKISRKDLITSVTENYTVSSLSKFPITLGNIGKSDRNSLS